MCVPCVCEKSKNLNTDRKEQKNQFLLSIFLLLEIEYEYGTSQPIYSTTVMKSDDHAEKNLTILDEMSPDA